MRSVKRNFKQQMYQFQKKNFDLTTSYRKFTEQFIKL